MNDSTADLLSSGNEEGVPVTREQADEFARWFRCLSDGTRLLVLNVVAGAGRALTVGEIVESVGKSQSTVSRHLSVLAEEQFVFMEPDGVRTLVRLNDACMTELPEAAALIMARCADLTQESA